MDHMTQTTDRVWRVLQDEAQSFTASDPLSRYVARTFAAASGLDDLLARLLSHQLGGAMVEEAALYETMGGILRAAPSLTAQVAQDLKAVTLRDPASEGLLRSLLFFKGVQAIETHRVAHHLYLNGSRDFALYLQSRASVVFGVDIHPAARLGAGLMMDHATGVVIGETAVVEDDVSILHGVTLGGTGNEHGDRHPKVRRGVMIGAGAKILGNIEIGEGACIASGSVVLKPVPPHVTVAGVPAQIVGTPRSAAPALVMDQTLPEE